MECRSKQVQLPTEQMIIIRIFKIVESVCNNDCKIQLSSIVSKIMTMDHLRFTEFSAMLDSFIQTNSITVPNSIQFQDLTKPLFAIPP